MKLLRLTISGLILTAIFSISVFAQAKIVGKIGVIDIEAFASEKGGITRYVIEQKKLNDKFMPVNQQIAGLIGKINALKKQVGDLQNSNAPVKPEVIAAKMEEHDKFVRELKFKKEDAESKIESQSRDTLNPIRQDIYKAMQEFAMKNSYTMIMDVRKLAEVGLILAFDKSYDVTEEFIKFYNARPAGTATN